MRKYNPYSKPIRLFQNERLERLTVITPFGFLLAWAPILPMIVWIAWDTAGAVDVLLLVGAGLLFWGLFEYAMHRFAFHWKPKSSLMKQFVFIMHGNHHDHPNDPQRNLMPPIASMPIAAALWLAMFALLGDRAHWFFLGFILGYLAYDILHYACHQWPMKGRVGMMFKRHHMRHHHSPKPGNYAVSTLFFDRLFGTHLTSLKQG